MRALVVGGGSWGTAFACVIARRGHRVVLACRDAALAHELERTRRNPHYLPGIELEPGVRVEPLDLRAQAPAADVVALAVPSSAVEAVASEVSLAPGAVCLSLAKGLAPRDARLLSDVIADAAALERARVAVLSGPNHAEEVGAGLPAASVVASASLETARRLQAELGGGGLRLYASSDVVGVQLCAAAKNVIALAAGASDGLGFGDNAKAALLTRGLAEMARLGEACGADARTYAGLAGMGDLVATCCSRHSRNRAAGELLAAGVPPAEVEARVGMTVEGLVTAPALAGLARAREVDMPLTRAVCSVLAGTALGDALAGLLARVQVDEFSVS